MLNLLDSTEVPKIGLSRTQWILWSGIPCLCRRDSELIVIATLFAAVFPETYLVVVIIAILDHFRIYVRHHQIDDEEKLQR